MSESSCRTMTLAERETRLEGLIASAGVAASELGYVLVVVAPDEERSTGQAFVLGADEGSFEEFTQAASEILADSSEDDPYEVGTARA